MLQKTKIKKMNRILLGALAGMIVMMMMCTAVFAETELNGKSDGIHVKDVPEGVATVTIGTGSGEKIVIDNSNAKGSQWKTDTRCDTADVRSVTLHYQNGTNRELALAYRTDSHSPADFDGAIIGNSGNGTLDIWIRNGKAQQQSPVDGGTPSETEKPTATEDKGAQDKQEAQDGQKEQNASTEDLTLSGKDDQPATVVNQQEQTKPSVSPSANDKTVAVGDSVKPVAGKTGKTTLAEVPKTGDSLGFLLLLTALVGGIALWTTLSLKGNPENNGANKKR